MEQKNTFFSIIIPAHNEEMYIRNTLSHIEALEYPTDAYEVLIVENGSTDKTYTIAKEFEHGNVTVFSSPKKGVSLARNIGIERLSNQSEWTILLDADTVLKQDFLKTLNEFLIQNESKNYAIGTARVKPIPESVLAQIWFGIYDIGHRLTHSSYAIQIVKSSIAARYRFDEHMTMGEELEFIQFALGDGSFFFFSTDMVHTSTRRFEKEGWFKIFFSWIFVAMLPPHLKKKFTYKVVR